MKKKLAPDIFGYQRGHLIYFDKGQWLFRDTDLPVPTVRGNDRSCLHCGKPPTKEGHDNCIPNLDGVKNACCGHGRTREAYIQFQNDSPSLDGEKAIRKIEEMTGNKLPDKV